VLGRKMRAGIRAAVAAASASAESELPAAVEFGVAGFRGLNAYGIPPHRLKTVPFELHWVLFCIMSRAIFSCTA
jgi:hypothetical protein